MTDVPSLLRPLTRTATVLPRLGIRIAWRGVTTGLAAAELARSIIGRATTPQPFYDGSDSFDLREADLGGTTVTALPQVTPSAVIEPLAQVADRAEAVAEGLNRTAAAISAAAASPDRASAPDRAAATPDRPSAAPGVPSAPQTPETAPRDEIDEPLHISAPEPPAPASSSVSHEDLPLADFDHLTLGSLRGRLRALSAADVEVLRDYERAHANRLPIVTMLDNRLAKLREPAST